MLQLGFWTRMIHIYSSAQRVLPLKWSPNQEKSAYYSGQLVGLPSAIVDVGDDPWRKVPSEASFPRLFRHENMNSSNNPGLSMILVQGTYRWREKKNAQGFREASSKIMGLSGQVPPFLDFLVRQCHLDHTFGPQPPRSTWTSEYRDADPTEQSCWEPF